MKESPLRHLSDFLLALLLLSVLLSFVGCSEASSRGHRVLVLGIDGLDPQTVDLLVSEGKMPHFKRLRAEGAYGLLRSQKPLLSPIIWTTIATGKPAEEHGIGHFVARDANGEALPVTSNLRRVEALWTIASAAERTVATVGWWATWPPEPVRGSIVSDHAAYHFLFKEGLAARDEGSSEQITFPPELAEEISPLLQRPESLTADELARYIDVPAEEITEPFDFTDELAHFRWALATAKSYRDIGLKLWREEQPDLELVYIEGTDSTSHLFGHLFRADGLGGELALQSERYGRAVEEIYVFADELVGEYLAALDENTTLVVLSDHGFELGALHDDPTQAGNLRRVSERFHREDGILYLFGRGVEAGAEIAGASILDITPTVLALLDLPAGEDMPGRFLSEAFTGVTAPDRIASWSRGESAEHAAGEAPGISDAVRGAARTPQEFGLSRRLQSFGFCTLRLLGERA